jgi:hypothetical protein
MIIIEQMERDYLPRYHIVVEDVAFIARIHPDGMVEWVLEDFGTVGCPDERLRLEREAERALRDVLGMS